MTFARTAALALPILALAAPAAPLAQDRPTIVVGSPDFRPFPVAIAAFQGDDSRAAADVNGVVRGDLAICGLFDVLDPKGFLADPAEGLAAPSIKFSRWADVGAEGLAKARLRRAGTDVEAELHLYEVRAGREVLAKTVRAASSDPRALGHRIANEIFKYYTREPGAFATKIAVIRKGRGTWELLLLDADGKNPRVLLTEHSILLTPSWRPDGKEILLTSYRSGKPEIWSFRLSDRSFRRIIPMVNAMGGVYSPDGARIAFTASENGNAEVWVMAPDGTGARKLTNSPALDLSPSWSPDGKRIAFVSDRAGTPQLYLMSAGGSDQRRLTFQGNYNQTPQWSPRGDLVAFTARDERKVFDLFAIAPDSGKITRITQDQGRTNEEPSWSPNGRMLVFLTDRNGGTQLVVSDPKGERQTVVAGGGGDMSAPAWGPMAE